METISLHKNLDEKKQLMFIASTLFIIFLLASYVFNKVVKKGKFTCEGYVLNTYIYICLSFLIIALQNLSLEYYKFDYNVSGALIFGIFLFVLGSIFLIHSIDRKKLLLKHLVWLVFILGIGFTFYPIYIISKYTKTFINALITCSLLVGLITLFVFLRPELVSLKMGPVLFWLLLIGVIMEALSYFVIKDTNMNTYKIYSYFFIIIFTLYLLYDTKTLKENAKTCIEKEGADYIKQSISMFLDMFNLLNRIIHLNART